MSQALFADTAFETQSMPLPQALSLRAKDPIRSARKRLMAAEKAPKAAPSESHQGSAPDIGLISDFLNYAAAAEQTIAEQQARIAQLLTLSLTDEMTGLANRRGFEDAMGRALSRAHRYEEEGVLGLFDLDGFKETNDRFGHQAGDEILKIVGQTLANSVRSIDCAARLGGDEFAVILMPCKHHGGREALHRLQATIARKSVFYQGQNLRVKASLGISAIKKSTDLHSLLFEADRAMYQNKRARR
ncbi:MULTISPECIES: GGDEF domain-containing protein [unclassified Iodidimonas]|jgi:diguanylate cyclase (GGDEF)-like protein|uniref:GGDEF domain-containing protein n=1 Tax=unclassified Iodidimonas TaxID=2626145 RepID=UPI002482A67E|nr:MULTISPECIES: GGDEF domain-containing protein [unclassified Iodidimonas]